jgi:hypothetical protein
LRKHLYFNSSNLKYCQELSEDDEFENVSEYPPLELAKVHQNEWGRIKTKSNYIHLLLGNINKKGCPWCGEIPDLITSVEDNPSMSQQKIKYYMQCTKCGSRGPVIFSNLITPEYAKQIEYVKEYLEHIYGTRKNWDDGLKLAELECESE